MSPETIRWRALECMQLAQNTDPQHRTLLLDLAHCWANLANAMDRYQVFAEAMEAGEPIDDARPKARPRPPRAIRPPRRRAGLGGPSSVHHGRRPAKALPLQRIAGR